jgi:hypothetical protein
VSGRGNVADFGGSLFDFVPEEGRLLKIFVLDGFGEFFVQGL